MTDKVRAALFDRLGPIDGFVVLDAYAGSGALGFEALSRGASRVEAVELGSAAAEAIRANARALGLSIEYGLHQAKVESWLAHAKPPAEYDLIFAMPPYTILDPEILERLGSLLKADGLLIVEHPVREVAPVLAGVNLLDTRHYGDPALSIYRK